MNSSEVLNLLPIWQPAGGSHFVHITQHASYFKTTLWFLLK